MEKVETVVIGAGQAGLALSRYLTAAEHEHVLLEQGQVAQRWRSERWDSFRLLTPNWQTRLPGHRYRGPAPEGFMRRDAVVRFFDEYAQSFSAPVMTDVRVRRVAPYAGRWRVWTSRGTYDAARVVVATGHYAAPRRPAFADRLASGVHQLFTRDYRSPDRLPDGAALVVGAGPSGQQVASELARSGRRVFLAVGRHRPLPRRYREQDVYWWLDRMGLLTRTIDTLENPHLAGTGPSAVLSGEPEDLDLRHLVGHGVVPLGHLRDADGTSLSFADDLLSSLVAADRHTAGFRTRVDDYVERAGLRVQPQDPAEAPIPAWALGAPTVVNTSRERIATVIWAAGYRRDYSWIAAPVFTPSGEPIQRRGITRAPGLMFLGLRFMYRRNSNFIDGVGADAAYLARRITGSELVEPAVA
jgi:putative flavoprotein involved in K+ transport